MAEPEITDVHNQETPDSDGDIAINRLSSKDLFRDVHNQETRDSDGDIAINRLSSKDLFRASNRTGDSVKKSGKELISKEVLILIRSGYNAADILEAESYLTNRGSNVNLSSLVTAMYTEKALSYFNRMKSSLTT